MTALESFWEGFQLGLLVPAVALPFYVVVGFFRRFVA